MLRQYFNCNKRLEIFLTCFCNFLCYVGSHILLEYNKFTRLFYQHIEYSISSYIERNPTKKKQIYIQIVVVMGLPQASRISYILQFLSSPLLKDIHFDLRCIDFNTYKCYPITQQRGIDLSVVRRQKKRAEWSAGLAKSRSLLERVLESERQSSRNSFEMVQ